MGDGNSKLKTQNSKLCLICVAAGRGRRFGSDKMSEMLGDRTVLETSIAALRTAIPAAPLVVVVAPESVEHWRGVVKANFSSVDVVAGGNRRQDSVRLGVARAVDGGAEMVAIHDAARPLVHPDDVRRAVDALGDADGAILCAPVVETVKRLDSNGMIRETVSREQLRFAQTPQVFRVEALAAAWAGQDLDHEWTDEAALLEAGGSEVRCVMAEHPNPKLTTAGDLALVRMMAGARP